jgi:DNA-binding Lrp family transcriptional regulator
LAPRVSRGEVLRIAEAKKRRRFGIFGPKEMLTGTELGFHPLVLVEVSYTRGLIRKSIRTSSFVLDGLSGDFVEVERGFRVRKGFSDLLGLGENPARVLVEIHRAGRATVADLEAKTGLSEGTIREAVRSLSERKLITYERVGRARAYLPIKKLTLPGLKRHVSLELPAEASVPGAGIECRLGERDLRDALKAIEPTAEVTRFEVFYYPIYTLRYRKRVVRIDGITGTEV